jgi:hypothetical protein
MRHIFIKTLAACALSAALGTQAQEAVRADVGKPLQAAQELIKGGKYKQALDKVREADAVGGKSANESYMIERMRIAAASGAGDVETAARSFEIVSPRISGADKLRMIESITGAYYRAGQYSKAQQWGQRYFKEGGTSGAIRTLLIQSQYLAGDFAGAAKELTTEIQQAERSGAAPGEDRLKLLVNATLKMNDTNGYVWALERLVTYYPKKEYWVDLLGRLQRKPNFSDRLALDVYRLSLATGVLGASARPSEAAPVPSGDRPRAADEGPTSRQANDFMEMAQLAVQAGSPSEAKQVMDKGFAANILGQGPQADRQKRLRDLIVKKVEEDKAAQAANIEEAKAAKDGTALANIGMNLVFAGDKAGGLKLMQEGIAKDSMKRPEDAKLHLGIAQLTAGEAGKAQATFKTVSGSDGTADLARLWMLYAKRR